MDVSIQGCVIIGTFALAHERFLELLRWFMVKFTSHGGKPHAAMDQLTAGAWSMFVGVLGALLTSANVFDAFRADNGEPRFFITYLDAYALGEGRWWIGCAIMGMAVTLGSKFWHDLAKGLGDVRSRIKNVSTLGADGKTPQQHALEHVDPDPPTNANDQFVQAA